eukprot:gene7498-8774_t
MSGFKKVIPFLDRVLVEKLSAPSTTAGGILLPQQKTSTNFARIVSVGTGPLKSDGQFAGSLVKEGDMVVVSPMAKAMQVPVQDKTYYLITESEILGIVDSSN